MGSVFSSCKTDSDEQMPPLIIEREGKYYIILNKRSFTEI